MERLGKHLDQLTEIDTLVGDIVKYRLVAVALVFHVSYLHLQSEILSYLSALYHRPVFTAFSLSILVHIHGSCQSVDAFDVVSRLDVGFLYLFFYESSCQRDNADVVSWVSFYSHDIPFFQLELVGVVVVSLACVFELHFYEVGREGISRHVSQPVIGVELFVLSSHSLSA